MLRPATEHHLADRVHRNPDLVRDATDRPALQEMQPPVAGWKASRECRRFPPGEMGHFRTPFNTHQTTNPIESLFSTVRNCTRKTKGCLNRKTAIAMVFRLMISEKKVAQDQMAKLPA